MRHRPSSVPVVLLLAVLLLASCTSGGGDGEADPAAGPGGGGVGVTVDALLASAGRDSADLTGELPVVASREARNDDGSFAIELNGVAVRGKLMTVVFTLRVGDDATGTFSPTLLFDDGRTPEGEPGAGPSAFSTDGVYVLDPAEGTRYLTAYDSEGRCVCSDALNSRPGLGAGSSIVYTSSFAAPPESTRSVDVVIPTVGAFTGVALER